MKEVRDRGRRAAKAARQIGKARLLVIAGLLQTGCAHAPAASPSPTPPVGDPFASIPKERWIAESPNAFAIRDRNPQAPIHVLVISKAAIPTVLDAPAGLLGEMLELAKVVATQEGIATTGFRLVINTQREGGQTVYHLHVHVLGGRQMRWPPG
jgi:histidine triad (HIT) family protein